MSSPASSGDATIDPVARFVGELQGYERLLRSLFAAGGRLSSAAAEAHASERMSITAGHQIFNAISNAQMAVSGALGHVAIGHRQLERLGESLGYDVTAYGDEQKPPKTAFFIAEDRQPITAA